MEIYRTGKKKAKKRGFDEEYDFVSRKDLSTDESAWTKVKLIDAGTFNKDAIERESAIGIKVTENDIVALYQGLTAGRQEKLANYEKLEVKIKKHKDFLTQTDWAIKVYFNRDARLRKKTSEEYLKEILSNIENFLKENN